MKSSQHGASPCWHAFCVAHFSQSRLTPRRTRNFSRDRLTTDSPQWPWRVAMRRARAHPRTPFSIGRHAFQSPTTRIANDTPTRPKRQRGRTASPHHPITPSPTRPPTTISPAWPPHLSRTGRRAVRPSARRCGSTSIPRRRVAGPGPFPSRGRVQRRAARRRGTAGYSRP